MADVLSELNDLAARLADVISKVDGTPTEDPTWTAVKGALEAAGWVDPAKASDTPAPAPEAAPEG